MGPPSYGVDEPVGVSPVGLSVADGDALADADGCGRALEGLLERSHGRRVDLAAGLDTERVWNSFSASVSAGVHSPSTGPSQYPASLSVCWTAEVDATASCAAAPPFAARSACERGGGRLVDRAGDRQAVGLLQGLDRVDRFGP